MAAVSTFAGACRSPDPLARHRSQYKCTTPPWKETYKKRCKERLRNGREKYLGRFRQIAEEGEASVGSVVEKVMDEEWARLSSEHAELPPWKPTKETCKPFANAPLDVSEESELNTILSIMEEIQQELMEEERQILAQYEENQRFEEESLCAAIESLHTEDVVCPVCKRNPLHQNKQVIFCACGVRIDTEQDGITLPYVRSEIQSSIETHHMEGCHSEPVFAVSDISGLGVNHLMLECNDCAFLYIIV